jgi:hypothetical protein
MVFLSGINIQVTILPGCSHHAPTPAHLVVVPAHGLVLEMGPLGDEDLLRNSCGNKWVEVQVTES